MFNTKKVVIDTKSLTEIILKSVIQGDEDEMINKKIENIYLAEVKEQEQLCNIITEKIYIEIQKSSKQESKEFQLTIRQFEVLSSYLKRLNINGKIHSKWYKTQ
jgi:hypothetical protein